MERDCGGDLGRICKGAEMNVFTRATYICKLTIIRYILYRNVFKASRVETEAHQALNMVEDEVARFSTINDLPKGVAERVVKTLNCSGLDELTKNVRELMRGAVYS